MRLTPIYRNSLLQLPLLVVCLWINHFVLESTLLSNLSAGFYPPEADSVGLPIFGSKIESYIVFGLAVIAALIPNTGIWSKIRILPLSVGVVVTFPMILGWADSYHWKIAISQCLTLFALFLMSYSSWRFRKDS